MGQQFGGGAGQAIGDDRKSMPAQCGRGHAQLGDAATRLVERRQFGGEGAGALAADRAMRDADRGQALVGVVGAQGQPVFGARGEHAVGLAGAAGHQIVDQNADIGVGAVEHYRFRSSRGQGGVEPGDQPLRRSLLIAGGAIDLPGKV